MSEQHTFFFGWKASGTITVSAENSEEAEEKAQHSITQLITADVGSVSVAKSRVNMISGYLEGKLDEAQ